MDENNTEMNGIGKEESAFVSELEEAIGLPEKENASGTAEPESMKNKKSAVASVFDIVEMFSICAAVILLLFTFAVRLTVVDGPSMRTLSLRAIIFLCRSSCTNMNAATLSSCRIPPHSATQSRLSSASLQWAATRRHRRSR